MLSWVDNLPSTLICGPRPVSVAVTKRYFERISSKKKTKSMSPVYLATNAIIWWGTLQRLPIVHPDLIGKHSGRPGMTD